MTADFLLKPAARSGLQPVDIGRHLGGLADLIELCFGAEMDASGRSVIREMRLASRLGLVLKLLDGLGFPQRPWNLGFVWVEAGRVVGSASTQPVVPRSRTWMIANVAVHPDHRRRGLALAILRACLDLIRSQGGLEAVLQVDHDNHGALALYQRLGFTSAAVHTAWRRPARLAPPPDVASNFDIRPRARGEWADQLALATQVRPEGLAWTRPLRAEDFAPGLWSRLDRFFSGQLESHWVATRQRMLCGSLTLQAGLPEGDRLVLLVRPEHRGQLERPLLARGLRQLAGRPWPVHLEHPADDPAAEAALREFDFQPTRVLRWMRAAVR